MTWNGRAVEWTMLHPEFKSMWAFLVHGAEACRALDVHPMFPTTAEIAALVEQKKHRAEGASFALCPLCGQEVRP